jgi:lipoprotein signal peptidase
MTPNSRAPIFWLWLLAALVFGVDQASKYGIFAWLEEQPYQRVEIVPRYFSFIKNRLNEGAVFGMGNTFGSHANFAFAIFSLGALGFIIYWSLQPEVRTSRWLRVALGLISGGALGNLYDRIMFQGVRDFLWFYIRDAADPTVYHFNFAVFNFADSCLVTGAIMLMLHMFFFRRPVEKPAETAPAPASVPAPAPTAQPTQG